MLGGLYFWETERVVAAKCSPAVQISLMLHNTLQRDATTPSTCTFYTVPTKLFMVYILYYYVEFN